MTELRAISARREAERRYTAPWFRKVFVAGALAAGAGRPVDACPYKRRPRGKRGWSAWRSAWLAGWAWSKGR